MKVRFTVSVGSECTAYSEDWQLHHATNAGSPYLPMNLSDSLTRSRRTAVFPTCVVAQLIVVLLLDRLAQLVGHVLLDLLRRKPATQTQQTIVGTGTQKQRMIVGPGTQTHLGIFGPGTQKHLGVVRPGTLCLAPRVALKGVCLSLSVRRIASTRAALAL